MDLLWESLLNTLHLLPVSHIAPLLLKIADEEGHNIKRMNVYSKAPLALSKYFAGC